MLFSTNKMNFLTSYQTGIRQKHYKFCRAQINIRKACNHTIKQHYQKLRYTCSNGYLQYIVFAYICRKQKIIQI